MTTSPENTAAAPDTHAIDAIDENAYTVWTDDDAQAFNDTLMHPALVNGPLPELLEGFITGAVISPFSGLADELLSALFEVHDMDWSTLDEAVRAPLTALTQKRMDAILDGLDQEMTAQQTKTLLPDEAYFVPLLTDWAQVGNELAEEAGEEAASDALNTTHTTTAAPTPPEPVAANLPRMAELWARGMALAYSMLEDDHWQLLDKRERKEVPRLYAPIDKLHAEGKAAITNDRQRLKLFDDSMANIGALYMLSQKLYERMAVTPAPISKTEVPGRNDPCSCGSGKKYKKCCGA